MCYSDAIQRTGKPIPAPLFNDVPDLLLQVIVAFDRLRLHADGDDGSSLEKLDAKITQLGKALDYDRSCASSVEWSPDHVASNSIWTSYMRCVCNQATQKSSDWLDLEVAIENARSVVRPT